MKQTAIEWLENKCSEFETIYDSLPSRLYEYIQQAKEMEKQQIIDAFDRGIQEQTARGLFNNHKIKTPEQYYNETYNK